MGAQRTDPMIQTQVAATGDPQRPRRESHLRAEVMKDLGWVRLGILLPKGKADGLVLCNVAVATKPGGGKSHCLLCDLPRGWDSMGLSSRTCAVCDSKCGLGRRPPLGRPPPVTGRPTSGGVQGPFCASHQAAGQARCVVCSLLGRVSIRGLYAAIELGLRVARASLPGLGQGQS